MKKNIRLILEDGTEFTGYSFGFPGSAAGEVVFNTAMTGYPESLSDPSYRGQILVLTYPLIGNYGVPAYSLVNGLADYFESNSVHIAGMIISEYSEKYNHWNAARSLGDWLNENKVPGIYGIDTRALTKRLREKGVSLGKIVFDDNDIDFYDPNRDNLVAQVSCPEPITYGSGKYKIILADCGVKNNIIRYLLKFDTTVKRVPWDYDFTKEDYDGLFLSNGPGDPINCKATIDNLREALKIDKPIFGICLGNQLLGLASGARTYKLKYGHRSHNQPVLMKGTDRAYITSQNHGFAIEDKSIQPNWEPYFINLNDQSNEGIRHIEKPVFSVQFHPEASGGPTDTEFLFHNFMDLVKKWKEK